jgi:hypothetical protein
LAKKENTDEYPNKTTYTLEAAFFYAGKILSLVRTKQGVAGLIQRIFYKRKNGPSRHILRNVFNKNHQI